MGALAIILARAGSKGAPGKNWRAIAGRPCVAWTIDAAKRAMEVGVVDRIALSTDGAELQRIGFDAGIVVVARPPELADDGATVDDAARHALNLLDGGVGGVGGVGGDPIVLLYGNVPVRPPGLIERCLGLMAETGCDSVQSYAPVGRHHPWWTAVVGAESEGARVRAWEGETLNHGVYRRQNLPPAHFPDGGALVVSRRALRLEIAGVAPGPHAFLGLDRRGVVNPEGSVVDIDNEIDLLVAEATLAGMEGRP